MIYPYISFKAFLVMTVKIVVLWILRPSGYVGGYQHFGGAVGNGKFLSNVGIH
jgi:hypothetical protein